MHTFLKHSVIDLGEVVDRIPLFIASNEQTCMRAIFAAFFIRRSTEEGDIFFFPHIILNIEIRSPDFQSNKTRRQAFDWCLMVDRIPIFIASTEPDNK